MSATSSTTQYLFSYFDKNQDRLLKDLFTFLRFKSISTQTDSAEEVRKCALWLRQYLSDSGFTADLWEGPGHPLVFASWLDAGEDKPTVLIYNHYDVQPVDPLPLWDTDPFEPNIKDGEIFARGITDNKGQCFYVIHALRALLERDGKLPINVKLCIEGEEESGSACLSQLLATKREQLHADHLFIVDLGMNHPDQPAVTLGCRGMAALTLEIVGANQDLHSGSNGGMVYNPNHALVELLAKLRDPTGRILVPGFYDDIQPLSSEEKSNLSFDFDQTSYEKKFETKVSGGEKDCSPLESAWIRPTLEINGLSGGYTGEGFKTVIPSQATAKISCRLVPQQNPDKVVGLLSEFLQNNLPDGLRLRITALAGGKAVRNEARSKGTQAAAAAYQEVCGVPCRFILEGGSIPITAELAHAAQAQVAMIGYSLPGDNAHAPNEHFGIERIRKGLATIGRIMEKLGE